LNEQVLIDAFTHVKNKGAYTKALDELQRQKDEVVLDSQLAIGMFDCDNLKVINDRYGHDKGDEYLKAACSTISDVFKHSPVFRVGGDEFAVILQNEDFKYMDWLIEQLAIVASDNNRVAEYPWNEVQVSSGFAVYDPEVDGSIGELAQRADKLMYENKRARKGLD
jgi:diguanylate cyclase (GGDEF)-like protein